MWRHFTLISADMYTSITPLTTQIVADILFCIFFDICFSPSYGRAIINQSPTSVGLISINTVQQPRNRENHMLTTSQIGRQ